MNAEQLYAKAVIEWLHDGGWEVYQEVVTPCGRCDIVAKKGAIRWAIEVKTSMNLQVLDQARQNVAWFHHSSVAVPAPKKNQFSTPRTWELAHAVAEQFGFGVIRIVLAEGRKQQVVKQDVSPRLNRRCGAVELCDEQKDYAQAGSSGGGYFTEFQRTARLLIKYTERNPGVALKEAIRGIKHHYASVPSATGALSKLIRGGVIEGVRLDNGKLFPVSPTEKSDAGEQA